jgi:hypothetical protein
MSAVIPLFPQKIRGAQGATGAQGTPGGATGGGTGSGAQGATGSQGATGAQGATGLQGATGTGTSYWQVNSSTGGISYLSSNLSNYVLSIGSTAAGSTGIFQVTGDAWISNACHAYIFRAFSDYRIKENIKLLDLSIYNIDNLVPVIYNHKTDGSTNIGFLAHEVQEYFPFLVSGSKDGEKTQSINYIGLIALLTKEIQELKKDNKQIKEILFNIENRN